MRATLILLYIVLFFQITSAQDSIKYFKEVKGDKYQGVIFPSTYKLNFHLADELLQNRFTPDISHINLTESAFNEQYNTPFVNGIEVKTHPQINNVKKHFRHFKRQYLGYINNSGDSIVLIQLLDFIDSPKRQRRVYFGEWKENFIVCFGDFCERYRTMFQFNLSSRRLEIPK